MKRVLKTLLLCCVTVAMTMVAQAQDDQPCMDVRMSAECTGFNGDGRPRYVIKFHANIATEGGDILYVSSSTGHVGTPTYKLPLDGDAGVFRYVHTGNSLKACFTLTVYAMTDDGRRRLCRVEKCIELPRCAPTCNDVRKLIEARPHLAPNGEDVVLAGVLGFSPFGVGGVSMEVLRGNHKRVCSNSDEVVAEPIRTEIARAAIKGLDAPRIEGNHAVWKIDSCVRFTQKRGFELLINLPPACPPVSTSNRPVTCVDTVTFCVRYTVKICPELRCDTVICYRIIRKCRTGTNTGEVNPGTSESGTTLHEATLLSAPSVLSIPNPANDFAEITLSMPYDDATASVDVVDMTGNVVARLTTGLEAGVTTIPANLQGLAAGTYVVRLLHADGVATQVVRIVR